MAEDKVSLNEQQIAWTVQNQQEVPKSTQGVFDLPCGYLTPDGELLVEVQLREITGVEEDLLASRNIANAKKMTQIIANCTERLGMLTERAKIYQAIRELPLGDRVFLFLAIRRVSLGEDFPFEETCPLCRGKDIYTISLAELGIHKAPNPTRRVFDATLPSGKKVRWHVMTGKEEEIIEKMAEKVGKNDEARLSLSILMRVEAIDDTPADLDSIRALSMRDRTFLRDGCFDVEEGGVETTIQLTCGNCNEEFETELNPASTGFFFPSRIRKNSKRSTSSS